MLVETSSKISTHHYDVFVNFRAEDTRGSFVDHFYDFMKNAGIVAFEDDDIQPGEQIEQAINNGMDNSTICVSVFSRRYASGRYCLSELERMVQKDKDIIPVYWGVTPDDVQLKTSMYTDDLARPETTYNKDQVQQWRKALVKVGKLKGFEVDINSFLDSIRELVGLISSKLKVKQKYELQHIVGMEDHTKDALSLLDIESGDKRILGIHGMAGVGKTTLAKCLFNLVSDKFDLLCFIEKVRLESSLDIEMRKIWYFKGNKILVVVDDIDGRGDRITNQLDTSLFGSGSRIIVTTRNKKYLEKLQHMFYYKVEAMEADRALRLFSKNAFGQESPVEDYHALSKEIVSICQGLPLALTVVGSFLHGQERPSWENLIKELQIAEEN